MFSGGLSLKTCSLWPNSRYLNKYSPRNGNTFLQPARWKDEIVRQQQYSCIGHQNTEFIFSPSKFNSHHRKPVKSKQHLFQGFAQLGLGLSQWARAGADGSTILVIHLKWEKNKYYGICWNLNRKPKKVSTKRKQTWKNRRRKNQTSILWLTAIKIFYLS